MWRARSRYVPGVTSAFGPAADRSGFAREFREQLIEEIGELEDGVTVAEVQERLQHAMERYNLELMEPGSQDRRMAIATLRELVRIGVTGAADELWERASKIHADTWPNLAQLIGVGAGVLDRWYGAGDDREELAESIFDVQDSPFPLDEELTDLCIEMLEHAAEHALFDNLPSFMAQFGGHGVYDAILVCLIETIRWSVLPDPPELEEQLERIS